MGSASAVSSEGTTRPSMRSLARWLKPAVTLSLYALVFYWTDAAKVFGTLRHTRLEFALLAIALYMGGQALSAWRWKLLLPPVGLRSSYPRMLGFYFTGMFFNLFLPTIVGGDAVKALLLSRETGAPARATISVFMERNVGLASLLAVAVTAAYLAPPVELFGLSLLTLSWLLALGYGIANVILLSPYAYHLADRVIAASPLSGLRARAASLYEAIEPYKRAHGAIASALSLSFVHQGIVIAVVFLCARALALDVPLAPFAVFVPIVSLAGMIPVSVNGLGVREALYGLLFGRVGVPSETAVSLALLYLGVTLLASLPGGVAYLMQPAPARLLATGRTAIDS